MKESSEAVLKLALSVDEAAIALGGVSSHTVRNLIAKRELRALRIGRRVLVSAETLAAFVKARESDSA